MMLLVKIICSLFILMVVLSDVVLPQCLHPIRLDLFGRITGSNQITLKCRWCSNTSDIQDPHLFVNSTDNPLPFRLENGLLTFNISQEMEGYYYCSDSPNNIGSNSVTLIAYPQPNSSIPTRRTVEVGQTITIDCPVAVGALRELYSFSWRKGLQTLDTTGSGTQYSVNIVNKSLTIASVQLDNNGTYYCDVTVSVPGVNPYFVPEEYTKITLFVTEQQPVPSTTTPTLKPSLPDQTVTLSQFTIHLNGITTGSPPGARPSMTPSTTGSLSMTPNPTGSLSITPNPTGSPSVTPNPPGQHVDQITLIAVLTSSIFGFLVLLILVILGCLGCIRVLKFRETPETAVEMEKKPSGTPDPEVQTGEHLRSGRRTPEYITFQKNYAMIASTLEKHISPDDLANKLSAAQLIVEDLKSRANYVYLEKRARINNLLSAVHNQIELNPTVYRKFIEILQGYSQLKELLKLLRTTWEVEVKQAEEVRTAADGGSI